MASAGGSTLFVYLLLASLTFQIDSRRLKVTDDDASQSMDTNTLDSLLVPPIPFPVTKLGSAYENQKYLGKGSFGMSFLVTEKATGRQMVMKLLFQKTVLSPGVRYYTWSTVKYSKSEKEDMVKAAAECDLSGQIHEQGKKLSVRHPGAQRVMNCFGHNIPVVDGKVVERKGTALEQLYADMEPLYLLLENCGDKDLGKFMAHMAALGQLTLVLVKELFKQIMEGLAFLASLPVPYIHHDLKPENIVVKTQGDDTYSVHLIDFGGTTPAVKDHLCIWTPCTAVYAPMEYDISNVVRCGTTETQNFEYCGSERDPTLRCPLAFDVWSAGCILPHLITGIYLDQLSSGFLNSSRRSLNHMAISATIHNSILFEHYVTMAQRDTLLKPKMKGYETVTNDVLASPETFLQLLAGMLAYKAKDRFVATDVLNHDWLSGISTADDHDYQAALPSVKVVEEKGAKEEKTKVEKIVPVVLLYTVNDAVEVFSRTRFRYLGEGWTVGTVTQAFSDGWVEVKYSVLGEPFFKTLDQFDSDIRPYISVPERGQIDDHSVSTAQSVRENFIPAKRRRPLRADLIRNEKPLANLIRQEPKRAKEPVKDLLSTAMCPSACWKCTPAIDFLTDRRKLWLDKYASYCYVPVSRGVTKIEDPLVKCTASFDTGLKYLQRESIRFLCQDIILMFEKPF